MAWLENKDLAALASLLNNRPDDGKVPIYDFFLDRQKKIV